MVDQKKKFQVGLFIIGGAVICLLVVMWVGMATFFEKGSYCVTYFDESVQGLQADSPVKYRGVAIGRVAQIGVAPDARLIEVIMKIDSPLDLSKGQVAQLKGVGITGIMFIELDQLDDTNDRSPEIGFPSPYEVIPSKPSEISELFQGIDDIIQNIQGMDLAGISNSMKQALDSVKQSAASLDVSGVATEAKIAFENLNRNLASQPWNRIIQAIDSSSSSFNDTMARGRNSLDNIDKVSTRLEEIVADNEKPLQAVLGNLQEASVEAKAALMEFHSLLENTDRGITSLGTELTEASRNLARATDNLNQALESLADQPGQLIFSEPAPPRKPGRTSETPKELTQ